MGDIILFYFLQNILLFSLIFWFLTWACEYFYKKKPHFAKKQFYECGFKSFDNLNIQINLNFALLCVFLVLYDIEFVFLVPFVFNLFNIDFFTYLIFIIFFLCIIASLIYDWVMHALSWSV